MNPERWKQVKELFNAALEREAKEREAFLNNVCGDESLRRQVYSLLAVHDESSTLIDKHALEVAACFITDSRAESLTGRSIGHYKIVRELGRGGMGEVYLAEDTRLGRHVALKMLPASFIVNPDRIKRFHQEARAASALNHPNIVTIHEIGESDGLQYIVTEYIEGETLRERAVSGRMTLSEMIDVAVQVAAALAAAHQAGIAHRDIKPENIMIRSDGYVKVVDFGLAKLTEKQEANGESRVSTNPGIVMGTVRYMSPEQARAQKVDARTDIFSLGVVLYELIAGRAPFEGGSNSDVIAAILMSEPAPLSRFAPDIPKSLEKIVEKALHKDKERRYQTIKEMFNDLVELKQEIAIRASGKNSIGGQVGKSDLLNSGIATVEIRADTAPNEKPVTGEIKRRRSAAAAASILFGIASLFGVYRLFNQPRSKLLQWLNNIELTKLATQGNAYSSCISPDGKYLAFITNSPNGLGVRVKQIYTGSEIQVVPEEDVSFWGLTFSHDGNFVYYLIQDPNSHLNGILNAVPTFGGERRKLMERLSAFSLSPDDKRVVFVRTDPQAKKLFLLIADTDGGNEKVIGVRTIPNGFIGMAWSPDGKLIAAADYDSDAVSTSLIFIPADGGSETPITEKRFFRTGSYVWSPDGRGIFMVAKEHKGETARIWFVSYPEGKAQQITNDFNDFTSLSVTADGKTLVSSVEGRYFNIFAAPNGDAQRAKQLTKRAGSYTEISYTPDGKILFTMNEGDEDHIWIMDPDGNNQRRLTFGRYRDHHPSISPDGRYIAFHSNRNGVNNIWLLDADGGPPKQLTDCKGAVYPCYSPDGKWIYYTAIAQDTGVWAMYRVSPLGGEPQKMFDTEAETYSAVSPDNKYLAYEFLDKASGKLLFALRSLDEDRVIKTFNIDSQRNFRWSKDGKALTYIGVKDDVLEIWSKPIAGGEPKQLTDFKSDEIFWFDWSPNGRDLVCVRGNTVFDAVMVKLGE